MQEKEKILKEAYDVVTTQFRGYRMKTYTHLFRIFQNNPEILWKRHGFLHCIQMNLLTEDQLLKSGRFTKDDFKKVWTAVWFISPHQYLKVKVDENKWVSVDAWSRAYGIPFGDFAHGFHSGNIRA